MKQSQKKPILITEATKHSDKMKLRAVVKQTLKNDKLYNSIKRIPKKQRYKIYNQSAQSIIKQLRKKQLEEKK